MQSMYYIGLDVHKKTISYCVKDGSGRIHAEGTIPATRCDLDSWMKTLPKPWTAAMEAHASQLRARNYVELQLAWARVQGLRAGVEHAQPLYPNDPLIFDSLAPLTRSARRF